MTEFFNLSVQFFVLLTPFAVLSTFLSMTQHMDDRTRLKVALRTGGATVIASLLLFYFGNRIFALFQVRIDTFQIGGGIMLFLNAVSLVRDSGKKISPDVLSEAESDDIAVVPLAIPMTVGPGTTAALVVLGAEAHGLKATLMNLTTLLLAIGALTLLLALGTKAERIFKKRGIAIISKLTGLFLSAFAAGMILSGVKSFMK